MTNLRNELQIYLMSNVIKMLNICIMKFRMDALHYALLAVLILIAVYCGNTLLRKEEYSSMITDAQINNTPFFRTIIIILAIISHRIGYVIDTAVNGKFIG